MSKRTFIELMSFLLIVLTFFLILNMMIPSAKSEFSTTKTSATSTRTLHYVALGDSLTEGVGDATKEGGFVPLLAGKIEADDNVKVNFKNFGKAGDTSGQIYERLTKKESKQLEAIEQADFITITVGGNNLMKAMSTNFLNVDTSSFKEPMLTYQKDLEKIFSKIRESNSQAEIYVLGIYNPFYLQFADISELQEVCDDWNVMTQAIVEKQAHATFIPINDLLYKGVNGEETITRNSGDIINDALSLIDSFHPNNVGYQIMANAIFQEYQVVKNGK